MKCQKNQKNKLLWQNTAYSNYITKGCAEKKKSPCFKSNPNFYITCSVSERLNIYFHFLFKMLSIFCIALLLLLFVCLWVPRIHQWGNPWGWAQEKRTFAHGDTLPSPPATFCCCCCLFVGSKDPPMRPIHEDEQEKTDFLPHGDTAYPPPPLLPRLPPKRGKKINSKLVGCYNSIP